MRSPEKKLPPGKIDPAKFLQEILPAVDTCLKEGNTAEAVLLLRGIEGGVMAGDEPERLAALRDRIGEVLVRCEEARRSILLELGQVRGVRNFERADEISGPGSWLSRRA